MKHLTWAVILTSTAGLVWGCSRSRDDADGGAGGSGNSIDLGNGKTAQSCPSTCAELNANCGTVTDTKCGGVIECGTCPSGEVCGTAGPNWCGKSVETASSCVPTTCALLGANCGKVSDGCGGLLDCGAVCPTGQICGALTPNHCDAGTSCQARACADLGVSCGLQGDGCGNQIDCGSCPSGQLCMTQGSKVQCVAVASACQPKTCAELGIECGTAGDGCSGTLNCGNSCIAPKICGGDVPGKCGCKGLCSQIPTCTAGKTTRISGKVYDPAGKNPLPNALVYIPNNPADPGLKPFPTRTATCDVCGATAAGDPLVSAKTTTDGSFVLENVPVAEGLSLVIQLGRWRRIFQIDVATPCETNPLPNAGKLTMPKNKTEGDVPHFAVVTGSADGMECVLWKMGVDTAEFTNPSSAGRIHLYGGSGIDRKGQNAGRGAVLDASTPSETELFVKNANGTMPLSTYDVLVLSCQGDAFGERATGSSSQSKQPSLAYYKELVDYGNTGGRIFASHYAYTYLRAGGTANPFRSTANWAPESAADDSGTATIITDPARNAKGQGLADWLALPEVGGLASAKNPTLRIVDPRLDVESLVAPSQAWMEMDWDGLGLSAYPLHYTFNTPVGRDLSCGRVVFSDFHVSSADNELTFPTSCGDRNNFSAQEKILEYMLFDLSACITPYTPFCTPKTCADQGLECGAAGDGCGNALNCGVCVAPKVCGLVTPGKCDGFSCTPKTCGELGYECGIAGDGCGAAINCGTCPPGQTCGAGGPGKCGTATCQPKTCAQQGIECGLAGDGCGGALDCGTCVAPEICGFGGPGKCGTPSCTPTTCAAQGIECGPAGDGCGAAINCGNCPSGEVCGMFEPGKCGNVIL